MLDEDTRKMILNDELEEFRRYGTKPVYLVYLLLKEETTPGLRRAYLRVWPKLRQWVRVES